MSNRVVHFEIQASEPEKIADFYKSVFGWEITLWEPPKDIYNDKMQYWMIMTGPNPKETADNNSPKTWPGINGGLVKRQGLAPAEGSAVNAYVCTIDVDNLDNYIVKVEENGGKITIPKMPIATVGWLAYATDPEGNIFGMMQSDSEAKVS